MIHIPSYIFPGWANGVQLRSTINFVINTHADPYASGVDGQTRRCDSTIITSTMTGQAIRLNGSAVIVTPNNEAALMAAVKFAPTTVDFDVEDSFRAYSGGIYSGTDCGPTVNHACEWSTKTCNLGLGFRAQKYAMSSSLRVWLILHWQLWQVSKSFETN